MARYDQWRKLSGDTGNTALLDAGKKLLGYLAGQRSLSGVKNIAAQVTTADGGLVQVRFLGDQPSIRVKDPPAKGGRPAQVTGFIEGIVVTPRTFASPTAYGALPQVILVPSDIGTGDEAWEPMFFDETYFPVGEQASQYYKNKYAQTVFYQGLPNQAQSRWTNADDTLALVWYDQQRYIFYNGQLLHDTGASGKVRGACLRREGSAYYLLYADRNTIYKALLVQSSLASLRWVPKPTPLGIAPPLFDQVSADVTIATDDPVSMLVLPTAYNSTYNPVAFSRDGKEARAVYPTAQKAQVSLVIDLLDLNAASVADTTTYSWFDGESYTEYVYTSILSGYGVDHDFYPSAAVSNLDPTIYPNPMSRILALWPAGNNEGPALGITYTSYVNTGIPSRSIPTMVEYLADNTPIYAYYIPSGTEESYTRSNTAEFSSPVPTASFYPEIDSYTPPPDPLPIYQHYMAAGYSVTRTQACSSLETGGSQEYRAGIYVPGFLDLFGSTIITEELQASSSTEKEITRADRVLLVNSGGPFSGTVPAGYVFGDAAGATSNTTLAYSDATSYSEVETKVGIWFLDLRTKSVVYSVMTRSDSTTSSASGTASGVAPSLSGVISRTTTTVVGDTTCTTYVVMNGVQVDSWVSTVPGSSNTVSSSNGSAGGGWYALYSKSTQYGTHGPSASTSPYPNSLDPLYEAADASGVPYGGWTSDDLFGSSGWNEVAAFVWPEGELNEYYGSSGTWTISTSGYAIGGSGILTAMGAGWATTAVTTPLYGANYGVWLPFRDGWVYSMACLEGANPTTRNWKTEISSGQTLDDITGKNGMELLGAAWPISKCVFATKTL